MKFPSKRNNRRIFRHHIVLTIICAAALFILYSTSQSSDIKFCLSLATGYVAIALLGVTLVLGSLNVLRRKRNPVSTDLRRDVGIWCGIVSLIHVIIGLQVHMGNMLLYFFYEAGEAKTWVPRVDLFGFANYMGLAATLIISLLLVLSNDAALRKLGSKRWKSLQRWNYGVLVLVVLHSIAYQILENRTLPYLLLFVAIVGATLLFQIAGFWRQKQKAPPFP